MLRLVLAFLHERDARPTMRKAVAIEDGQVHEAVGKDVRDHGRDQAPQQPGRSTGSGLDAKTAEQL